MNAVSFPPSHSSIEANPTFLFTSPHRSIKAFGVAEEIVFRRAARRIRIASCRRPCRVQSIGRGGLDRRIPSSRAPFPLTFASPAHCSCQ